MINYNKPFLTGKENKYINEAILSKRLSGDGPFTKTVTSLLESITNSRCLLTTSCTDALEMSADLLNIEPGDEVVAPSYTFVSTVLPFIKRGATIKFADSSPDSPHIGEWRHLRSLKTKAVIPVHYAGIACEWQNMFKFDMYHIWNYKIIEDAAQAIGSTYYGRHLGSIGDIGTISFHESKNLGCGEGGAILLRDARLSKRAEILREKGTDRSSFFRGEVDKYGWVDIGSSHLPSDMLAAFLLAQLESMEFINSTRLSIWNKYLEAFQPLKELGILLPIVPEDSTHNAHIFYLVVNTLQERNRFIEFMKEAGISCVFHYQSLHKSKYFINKYEGPELVNADKYTDCLVRLPLYPDLTSQEVEYIIKKTKEFFGV